MPASRRLLFALILAAAVTLAALPGTSSAAARVTGSSDTSRVTGGVKAPDSQYQSHLRPLVALIRSDATNQYDGQFCAGTLIDELHVLTAGHCLVEDGSLRTRSAPSSIRVLAGTPALNEFGLSGGELVRIAAIFVNPNFNIRTMRWDAAVLRLERPITSVPIASRLTDADVAALGMGTQRTMGLVAGWGDTNPNVDGCCFPSELKSVTVPIHPNGTCVTNLANAPGIVFGTEMEFCAGRLSTSGRLGADTCQGDSGGPLFVESGGVVKHAGVTSFGVGCGQRFFGVYARTTALAPWLDSIPGIPGGDPRDPGFGPGNLAAPTVTASAAGYRGVRLNITPAAAGEAPTKGYTIWARDGRPAVAKDIYLGRTTSLDGVLPVPATNSRVPYTLLLRAVGEHGEGVPARFTASPKVDLVKPSRPAGVRAVRSGNRITVTWRASVDRQSGVHGYSVQKFVGGRWRAPQFVRGRSLRFSSSSRGRVRVLASDWAGNRSLYSAAVGF